MSWGATPYQLEVDYHTEHIMNRVLDAAREAGEIRRGDLVAVLSGSKDYPGQATDTLQLFPLK